MRALLSVYDKAGIVELARGLHSLGWELVSSGGTARALADAGLPVTSVEEVTGSPEMLGHRVVTLHPKIHGGILADRDLPEHRADLARHGIDPIDLVVVNLYPFSSDPSIELIDIGGPAMVRAAAKNHAHVGVIVDPADYPVVLQELHRDGSLSVATRRRLAAVAFERTSAYDAAIVEWLVGAAGDAGSGAAMQRAAVGGSASVPAGADAPAAAVPAAPDAAGPVDDLLPPRIDLALERVGDELRYGENPHQRAARYRLVGTRSWWDDVEQHSGLALSYLNLYDADAAWAMVHDLARWSGRPTAVIVKHANPCGVALADDLATAYQRAYECDERSAFGGIVALSQPVDPATAERMVAAAQADVVIAPGYGDGVVDALRARRKNTRVLQAPPPDLERRHLRQIGGGFLVQDAHRFDAGRDQWRVVTTATPTEEQWRDAELAWRICGHVKSNAIVLVRGEQAVGIGAGQQNRVEAGKIAADKAAGRAAGGACASDAFYPFPDGVEAAADAGVAVVMQPGGSVRDDAVVAAADERGLAMVFTGERHFLH
ncbi:MAG: bifunctional phosphoribosylaminoimidazolecarboxamide formyltransferase/IMP cyclohydrolase [Actinomycetota bacterium]|nr:bifunctional phosphoribosylaminoimidazolecarboxamide formyltransferase/IMP cyclohydrolase [Actinomycetota bacterium]